MPDASSSMSRELRAAAEFTNGMSHLRAQFELPEDRRSVDAMTEAALRFGSCELRMRRSERLQALGVHKAEAKELAKAALADHELGLAALPGARPLAARLSKLETDGEALARWRKEVAPRLRAEVREHVAELDLPADTAKQLVSMMDEGIDVAEADGFAGLGKHLSRTLDALDKARRSKNRGTQIGTFPYWKIIAAAAFWGFGVAATISLIINGAPWWHAFLVWLFVAIVTFCIALGCSDG